MEIVGTSEAAYMLNISAARIRKLLSQGRIKAAYKVRRCWRIPLYNGMPQVIEAKRGPKGLWYCQPRSSTTKVYINKEQIGKNSKLPREQREPVIIVEQGKRKEYGYQVDIDGPCRLIYSPDRALHGERRTNPVLWLETSSRISFVDMNGEPHKCRLPYQQLPTAKKKPTRKVL